ncbi:cysteine proteinase [Pluteus cervinus]|uniref:Cysteine proteinase n=1 Tax=Pluteus cervinus TaxID=181527 RepID=A0ACD3B409_9AGAR|nr:cysteine proteinase [Pluteus cervinus]
MAPLQVQIKHAGKTYDVDLDPDLPPVAFKEAIYQVTGVPVDRMKVMVKSGILKDDTPWKKINPKQGQSFMVVGAAGELPKPPEKPTVFLEDMDDEELAEALAKPVGLRNLGNTCYMNSTVQALRTIPELQIALSIPALQSDTPLPAALRDLYHTMSRTADSITPKAFLDVLRQVNPQFAERDRGAKGLPGALLGYAQQDAEECYGQLITSLRNVPGIGPNGAGNQEGKKFVDQYLMGEIRRELTCDDAPDEPPSVTVEKVLKLECNITITTNYLASGLQNAMDQKVEKESPTLGRQAVYSQKSRITRLPAYLTIHMARFSWRQDIMKKTKIMRKVKFPVELDALDLASEELKTRLLPVSRRLKEIEKERFERQKIRKRTKVAAPSAASSAAPAAASSGVAATPVTAGGDVEMQDGNATAVPSAAAGGELEDEHVYRARELAELEGLVNEDVKKDTGASVSGLYELVAIITHKGAAADAGHYMAFAKKSAFHPRKGTLPAATGAAGSSTGVEATSITGKVEIEEDDEDWYKFDDEKVSIFPQEKLATLDGGGEDSSAYVLLYKSKSLA